MAAQTPSYIWQRKSVLRTHVDRGAASESGQPRSAPATSPMTMNASPEIASSPTSTPPV
jgi:hypothetical protein